MKRVILIVALLLCLVGAGYGAETNVPAENDRALTLWVSGESLAYQNTNLGVMLGIRQKNVELGVAAEWRIFSEGDTDADIQSDFAIGPYGAYHFPGLIDVNNPIDVGWLPDKLLAEPFVSLAYLIDRKGQGAVTRPGVGIRVLDIFALSWDYSFYQGVPADNEGRFGLSAKWEF